MTLTRLKLTLLAPVTAFALLFAVLLAVNRSEAPSPPSLTGDAGRDVAAGPGRPSRDLVRDYQRAARAAPANAAAYAGLGEAYLQRARETGDPTLYRRAERAFDSARRRDARSVEALVGAATLANLRHDFRAGLRLGAAARSVAPELARPLTVIADAQIELGRYRDAARTIQRLVDLKPTLSSYARVSYYRELSGDLSGAVEAMRLAVSAGGAPESVAYVQTLLGDLELQRGRTAAARAAYRDALASAPPYPQALAGLARVDAAGGGLDRAAARLRRAATLLPLTSHLILLAETELAAGRSAQGRRDLAVVRAQQRLLRSAGTAPDAELVLFEANHGSPRAAVRLGRRVWRAAPSMRSADALGWALTRAGRPGEGLVWAGRALRRGSRDPLFRLHAGLAARAAGRRKAAARNLSIARAGAAALPPLAREALR